MTAVAAAPAVAPASSALSEEVQSAFEYLPATLVGMIAGAGVVSWLFSRAVAASTLLPWLGAFTLLWLLRLLMLQRYRRALRHSGVDWLGWRRLWVAATLVSGALWGLTAWLFYPHGSSVQQTGLIIIVYTYCIAAVPVLAQQPRVFLAFAALCFTPMIVRIALADDPSSYQLAGELLLIVSLTTVLARSYRQALQRVTELKLQTDRLLAEVQVEKRAAEAARHEAEVANRAKTQFLAAASHDLRQPLHAMGLFAEALRQRTHQPEVMQLVNSINESVGALEGLFSELLDITRLDGGGVAVDLRSFSLTDIFARLRLHFEPAAFEKGLALKLRGGAHVVRADPVLVERVLSNLVSNAIRYSEDGGVLVGCRRRADHLLLQVWDTGVGIAPAEQGRVFEEFYQVPGRSAVGADQRRGLGLGLSIVQRLAALMQAPLQMRSEPGRGTVFTLQLPIGLAQAIALPVAPPKTPLGVTLHGRLVVVVEDDPGVRAGLEVLLVTWGATVASFDSVGGAEEWAAAAPRTVRPDLVIADYRLEAGRSGIEAIVALRGRFGESLPAIVVTGSTLIGHEVEATVHDFHLLTKPVLPNRLRAMISFKLTTRPAVLAA